jgi:hypothetical protein
MTAGLIIGYDVEAEDQEVTSQFLEQAVNLHTALDVPATFFLLGKCVERSPKIFEILLKNSLFEIQQHTYSHVLFKTVCQQNDKGIQVFPGGTLEEIEAELRKANEVIEKHLGVKCTGVAGPFNYYRGLSDRLDILEIIHKIGLKYIRTYGRNENDWFPVSLNQQPFWYSPQGYPQILEVMIHGWQDCLLRPICGWEDLQGYLKITLSFADEALSGNKIFSYCAHDHSSIRADPKMTIMKKLIQHAQSTGLPILSYGQYYQLKKLSHDRLD